MPHYLPRFYLILICLFCPANLLLAQEASKQINTTTPTVKLVTTEWRPYTGQKMFHYGMIGELVIEAFKRAGYAVKIEFRPWVVVLDDVKKGRFDAAFPAYYTEERDKQFILSEPFASSELVLFKNRSTNISYKNLESLRGFKIGVVAGYANSKEFDDAEYLMKRAFPDDRVLLKQLLANKVDLAAMDKLTALHLLHTGYSSHLASIKILHPKLDSKKLYLLFSKHSGLPPQAISSFNLAIQQMKKDGSHDLIVNRYNVE